MLGAFMKILSTLLVLGFLVASSAGAPSPDAKQVEAQIRKAIADWIDANNRGDHAEANKIWAPGVKGWFPENAEFKNAAAFRDKDAAVVKKASSTFSVTIEEVMVCGDLAVVRDKWRETLHLTEGSQTAQRTIWSFEVWKPQADGQWKIARWISAPEPWESVG